MNVYDYTKYLLLEDQKINEFENEGIVKLYDANKNFGDLIIKNIDPDSELVFYIGDPDYNSGYFYKYKDILNSKNNIVDFSKFFKFIFIANRYFKNLNIIKIEVVDLNDKLLLKSYDKTLNCLFKIYLRILNPRSSIFDPYTYNPFIKDHIKFISKI